MKIAIIGGGAAGYTAAIAAAERGLSVTIYERCDKAAKKILATGNGRCNMSNINADVNNYHGANPKFISGVMHKFWVDETLDFFERLGIVPKIEENGKIFPFSYQAAAVSDVLRFEAQRLGVNTVCGFEVSKIKKSGDGFLITSYSGRETKADKIILAAGGKASPSLGSNGSGYELAKSLGHRITRLFPSLVQIKTDNRYTKALQGLKINGSAAFYKDGKRKKVSDGEILFTDYGLSGPPIFNLSRLVSEGNGGEIRLDLMPEFSKEEVAAMLKKRSNPQKPLENYLIGMLPKKLGQVLLKACGIAPLSRMSTGLSGKEIDIIAEKIKAWSFAAEGTMPWNNAQVTAGGVDTAEVNPTTLESKKVKGLYFAGEILDIDGDCGGYNLQWAWSSGYIAGMNV